MNDIIDKPVEDVTDIEIAIAMRTVWFYIEEIDNLSWFFESYDYNDDRIQKIVNNKKLKTMADNTLEKFDRLEKGFKAFRKEYQKLLRKKSKIKK